MQEIITTLPIASRADYLLDTCFFIHVFKNNMTKKLSDFCRDSKVGMSSFNLGELIHVHHKFPGQMNHHIRSFLKQEIISNVPVSVNPGDREGEKYYVEQYDTRILKIIKDPSDAVLLVLAMKMNSCILTKDRHHLFTAAAENYSHKILKEFPS